MLSLIERGEWKEGEKIPGEVQLSSMFNVSRAVIREMLQRLRSEKRIITRHGIGSFVANPLNYSGDSPAIVLSESALDQITEFRESVEIKAIELAAARRTEEDIASLFEAVGKMQKDPEDPNAFTQADYAFHEAVVAASHNAFLIRAFKANKEPVIAWLTEMNKVPESWEYAVYIHRAIAESLRDHKGKEAISIMKKHDEYNRIRMVKIIGEQVMESTGPKGPCK